MEAPFYAMVDCKSVVDIINKYISGGIIDMDKLQEVDLWEKCSH